MAKKRYGYNEMIDIEKGFVAGGALPRDSRLNYQSQSDMPNWYYDTGGKVTKEVTEYIIHPVTGNKIKVGGPAYKKLNEQQIKLGTKMYQNINPPKPPPVSGIVDKTKQKLKDIKKPKIKFNISGLYDKGLKFVRRRAIPLLIGAKIIEETGVLDNVFGGKGSEDSEQNKNLKNETDNIVNKDKNVIKSDSVTVDSSAIKELRKKMLTQDTIYGKGGKITKKYGVGGQIINPLKNAAKNVLKNPANKTNPTNLTSGLIYGTTVTPTTAINPIEAGASFAIGDKLQNIKSTKYPKLTSKLAKGIKFLDLHYNQMKKEHDEWLANKYKTNTKYMKDYTKE